LYRFVKTKFLFVKKTSKSYTYSRLVGGGAGEMGKIPPI